MGREEIFHTFLLLVEIEGHFTHELVSYVYETEDWSADRKKVSLVQQQILSSHIIWNDL
jgi:hypothetical protein